MQSPCMRSARLHLDASIFSSLSFHLYVYPCLLYFYKFCLGGRTGRHISLCRFEQCNQLYTPRAISA
ncbi:unnamed protein product [Triticum turgidum subsp. durum]|uniref:Uncharacterized protein n=1 Tax=Triticum turgidum subsp. durum TaxID=4567 RepID=A0A9R0VLG2_TRITD|nr:unnamed protein product [Triticum turgidum subsp. durum]